MSDHDEQLALKAAAGDAAAFDEIVARYGLRLIRFLVLNCKLPVHTAEDLAQETWLRAWQALPHRNPGPFRGWLFTIARNLALSHQRRPATRRSRSGEEIIELVAAEQSKEPSAEATAIERETLGKLADCLDKLPPEFRQVIELHAGGAEYVEIAELVGIAMGTVKSRLFRSRQDLARCLEGVAS